MLSESPRRILSALEVLRRRALTIPIPWVFSFSLMLSLQSRNHTHNCTLRAKLNVLNLTIDPKPYTPNPVWSLVLFQALLLGLAQEGAKDLVSMLVKGYGFRV